jgi:cysteine desulfurase
MNPVYLDHNATTPIRPESRAAMAPYLGPRFGNPQSLHRTGQEARRAVEDARRSVLGLLGADEGDLVFTASGTESVLGAILGACRAREHPGHLVLSSIEHPSGLAASAALEGEGWEVTRVSPGADGTVSPREVEAALTPQTALVSVQHANNETGVIHPVPEIASLCRARGILFHTDAVQSAGKIPLAATAWGADLVSVASHKLGGPKGAGALWRRAGVPLRPLLPGSQEGGLRGGTVDVPAVVGFGVAAACARSELSDYRTHTGRLRDRVERAIRERIPGAGVTGGEALRLSNTTHLTFGPEAGPDLVLALDLAGFAVSAGAACRSGAQEPSHVLLAQGIPPGRARTAVRISTGMGTRESDLDALVSELGRLLAPEGERIR